jgi:acetyl-CoA C-acetyltransferase
MSDHNVVIVSAQRTPIGAFQGVFAPVTATQLGTACGQGRSRRRGREGLRTFRKSIFGCVLPAGLGRHPRVRPRSGAGVPASVPATTLNKMCGSGMKAVMAAADQIRTGDIEIALAGRASNP